MCSQCIYQCLNCNKFIAVRTVRIRPDSELYRLPKLCLIMHLVHTIKRAPQYLSDSVQTVARSSSRPGLRSSNTAVYTRPRCRTKFGERGFSHAEPTAWNSLPHHLHVISDTGLFKRRPKTELFRRAYVASSC